jgi:hypothetical protein
MLEIPVCATKSIKCVAKSIYERQYELSAQHHTYKLSFGITL